jgi:hypothetical protein
MKEEQVVRYLQRETLKEKYKGLAMEGSCSRRVCGCSDGLREAEVKKERMPQ